MSLSLFNCTYAKGINCAMGASLYFSINDLTIKFLSHAYALPQVVRVDSSVGLVVILMMLVLNTGGINDLKTKNLT